MSEQAQQDLPTYTDSPRIAQPTTTASADDKCAGVASALARFEYEAEKTSVADATKVLLIEWEEEHGSSITRDKQAGQWSVQWKGRNNSTEGITIPSAAAQLPGQHASHGRHHSTSDPSSHRLYFLLPPGAPVPPSVSISFSSVSSPTPEIATSIPTLPAIFPPSLLTSGTSLGKKGVLHTLWAKSRMAALRAEIDEEEEKRFEGIGIEMARDELEWIKEHFGVSEKHHGSIGTEHSPDRGDETAEEIHRGRDTQPKTSPAQLSPPLSSPTTATSPSDRLQQKMKGLRVGTSPSSNSTPTPPSSASSATTKHAPNSHTPTVPAGVFTPPQTNSSNNAEKNPLSPEVGDVAVGSRSLFAALKGPHPSETPKMPAVPAQTTPQPTKKPVAVAPPPSHGTGAPGFTGMASLDSIASATQPERQARPASSGKDEEPEEGLFALPMSPRSPEMQRSPFSLGAMEAVRTGSR